MRGELADGVDPRYERVRVRGRVRVRVRDEPVYVHSAVAQRRAQLVRVRDYLASWPRASTRGTALVSTRDITPSLDRSRRGDGWWADGWVVRGGVQCRRRVSCRVPVPCLVARDTRP